MSSDSTVPPGGTTTPVSGVYVKIYGEIMADKTLLPTMRLRLNAPTDLIDLGQIADLRGIKVDGSSITIGAMVSHAEVSRAAEVVSKIPALAELAGLIGDAQVRNRGTLGGSIANNDPAADYPAAVLALGGTVHTTKRKIAADEFFKGLFETALAPGELITSVTLPIPKKAGYAKFKNPDGGNQWDWWELPGWAHNSDWPNMPGPPPTVSGKLPYRSNATPGTMSQSFTARGCHVTRQMRPPPCSPTAARSTCSWHRSGSRSCSATRRRTGRPGWRTPG